MAYSKKEWKGRLGTGLNKYIIDSPDGAGKQMITSSPDTITQEGDALSAANLNDLEDRIDNEFTNVNTEIDKVKSGTTVVKKAEGDEDGANIKATYAKKTDYVPKADIVDGLSSSDATKVLSAKQGKVLDDKVKDLNDELEDGTFIVKKAECDKNGDDIPETYAKKDGGPYAALISGLAMNLVGKGTVGAEISFRTAGGTADIGSGSARLDKIKGNSVNKNQKLNNGNFSDGSTGWIGENFTFTQGTGEIILSRASGTVAYFQKSTPVVEGHKVLFVYNCYKTVETSNTLILPTDSNGSNMTARNIPTGSYDKVSYIETIGSGITNIRCRFYAYGTVSDIHVRYILSRDLTLIFGSGNEPTLAQIQANYPELLEWSDYDVGSTDSMVATGLETTGFNQLPPDLTVVASKYISSTTGKPYTWGSTWGYMQEYTEIFGGMQYELTGFQFNPGGPSDNTAGLAFYDSDKNFISGINYTTWEGQQKAVFTTPTNARYLRFSCYATTKSANCCLHLVWSGIRNGESEEYWKSTLNLPITTVTGKQTGSDTSEVIFPSGMNKIDDVYDELTAKKAVKRINKINLGTLDWSYVSNGAYFKVVTSVPELGKLLCNQYDAKASATYAISPSNLGSAPNMSIYRGGGDVTERKTIYLKNTSKTASDLIARTGTGNAAWLDDVWLYYSGDAPIEYTLDEEQNFNYRVDDFGTEKLLPTTGTAPLLADIAYAMNAVDQLRRMTVNYDNTASLDNLCASLSTALSNALNGTFTITRGAYDENTQTYAFSTSFTPNE